MARARTMAADRRRFAGRALDERVGRPGVSGPMWVPVPRVRGPGRVAGPREVRHAECGTSILSMSGANQFALSKVMVLEPAFRASWMLTVWTVFQSPVEGKFRLVPLPLLE